MNTNIKKLNRISRKVDLSRFYVITVYDKEIKFQGKYNALLVKYLKSHKFIEEANEWSGYMEFRRSNIEVVLSD